MPQPTSLASSSRPRALLIALDNVGDLVFIAPLCEALAPHYDLTVFCKQYTRELALRLPGAPRVVAADPFWDRSPGLGKGNFRDFWQAFWQVRQQGPWDLSLVTSRMWKAAAVARFVGSQRGIGYDLPKARWFLSEAVPYPSTPEAVVQERLRLLAPLSLSGPSTYALADQAFHAEAQSMAQLRQAKGWPTNFVALHPFAGGWRRCWPLGQWLQLAQKLVANGEAIVWLGTEAERQKLRDEAKQYGQESLVTKPGHALTDHGPSTLVISAALSRAARAFIGHDSGPLHVAAAMGVPCLGLYLPGEPQRTFPQGRGSYRYLTRLEPSQLSFDDVWTAWLEIS